MNLHLPSHFERPSQVSSEGTTGTGKTRTVVALVDVLMKARWAKRVLLLVDRIALKEQAIDAFKEFIPSEPRWPEIGERSFVPSRRIHVCTYPTMLGIIQAGATAGSYLSPHFFDVVIADESHRSLYNVYSQVLDYFNALKIGLTATPRDHIDHDTFMLFDCGVNDPTFACDFEQILFLQTLRTFVLEMGAIDKGPSSKRPSRRSTRTESEGCSPPRKWLKYWSWHRRSRPESMGAGFHKWCDNVGPRQPRVPGDCAFRGFR